MTQNRLWSILCWGTSAPGTGSPGGGEASMGARSSWHDYKWAEVLSGYSLKIAKGTERRRGWESHWTSNTTYVYSFALEKELEDKINLSLV